MSPTISEKLRDSDGLETTYVLQNKTGVKLTVIVDGRRLHPVSTTKSQSPEIESKIDSTFLVAHTIAEYELLGLLDCLIEKAVGYVVIQFVCSQLSISQHSYQWTSFIIQGQNLPQFIWQSRLIYSIYVLENFHFQSFVFFNCAISQPFRACGLPSSPLRNRFMWHWLRQMVKSLTRLR